MARWQRRLWWHARNLTGRSDAAWDVTQDGWLAIIRSLGRLSDPARFGPWAFRIVSYDETREDGLRSVLRDFYSRKQMESVVLVWTLAVLHLGLAAGSAILFFRTKQPRLQILCATLFVVAIHELGVLRVFAWQMAHRRNLKREIKRLELCVAELNDRLGKT